MAGLIEMGGGSVESAAMTVIKVLKNYLFSSAFFDIPEKIALLPALIVL